ncbi:MAG: ISL3 family transposase [Gammaproteobacteria bacterium]|jgi:transposase
MEIEEHYSQLLGIHSPWEIANINLNTSEQRVDIMIEYTSDSAPCPECGTLSPKHDDRQERTWRHLDTMQFGTYLHCRLPRVRCKTHGVKSVEAPWAGKSSRFTLLFEAFAVRVLQAARSVEEARKLLKLNWHQVEAIKARAVQRGLARREEKTIPYIGIDEKQFRSGHQYISSLFDLEGGCVLDVVEERTEEACKRLIDLALTESQKEYVTAIAMDMWLAFADAVSEKLPQAAIVHDRFHISKHLNEAVDKVRRWENRERLKQGDERLKGSKYWWLSHPDNLADAFCETFESLKNSELKVARAWAIKELFRDFWTYNVAGWAKRHFDKWYSWAIRSRLKPIKEKAKMLRATYPIY